MYASGLLHYFITFVLSIKFHRFYIYIVSYIWSCYNFSKLNAILVHDLPWIAFIFYFQNVQEAKNVSLLLFTFNILSLKIVLEKFQNWTTNLAFYGYFTKCKCFKFANIHCMSTYVYLDGLSLAVCVSYRIYKKMRRNLLYLAYFPTK